MTTSITPIFVAALGASTPLGRDAWSSAAAVRAGISAFVEHPFMIDSAGAPMRAAIVPWLDIGLGGVGRFMALLFPAIDQALAPLVAQQGGPALRIALSLGLPSPRPGLADDLSSALGHALREHYPQTFAALATFPAGHAAGLLALDAALGSLARGAFDACVVAGVDSYIDPETLEWLEGEEQLHSAGPLNNAWGFIPGEGAGALLLVRQELAERLGLPALARVLGVGSALEPKRIKTRTVCIGEGLTAAVRSALAALPGGVKVSDVYCDMNGEPYRADEYGFCALRTKEAFESVSDFVAPADCWGDVAAAGGALHVMLAAIAGAKSYAKGPVALAWASAEGGERCAALLALGGQGA
jgi:3-oxoacyl-[acyl-carrier-protein] synthase-1